MSETECPTCGKSDFSDESYMKRHHKLIHGESLRQKYECSIGGCNNKSYNPKFCSQECLGKARRAYEFGTCEAPECDNETYKQKYCSNNCANKNSWRYRDNAAKREEVRRKLSEMRKGKKNPFYGETHSDEVRAQISESIGGENHPHYGVTGKDHPSYGKVSGLKLQTVEETGHTVRSNWEKEIDLMLHNAGINYEYESRTFELSDELTYTPDFIVEDVIIEVKGWPDDKSKRRARLFMQGFSQYTYLVIGNKLPCDIFIKWKNRDRLLGILEKSIEKEK